MTALLYRGHTYEAAPSAPKVCVELTYRREHYNTLPPGAPARRSPHPHLPRRHLHQVGQGKGLLWGELVRRSRFARDLVIVGSSLSAPLDGNGSHRHRDFLGVSRGGICDCQFFPSGVVGGGVLGGAGQFSTSPLSWWADCKKKGGCSLDTPCVRRIAPSPKEATEGWQRLLRLVVAIATKHPCCEGPKKKARALRSPHGIEWAVT